MAKEPLQIVLESEERDGLEREALRRGVTASSLMRAILHDHTNGFKQFTVQNAQMLRTRRLYRYALAEEVLSAE